MQSFTCLLCNANRALLLHGRIKFMIVLGNNNFFYGHRKFSLPSMTLRDAISFILDVRVILIFGHVYIICCQSLDDVNETFFYK
jgi:hypothetical protein